MKRVRSRENNSPRNTQTPSTRTYLVVVILCWFLCTIAILQKYLSTATGYVAGILGCLLVGALFLQLQSTYRRAKIFSLTPLVLVCCLAVVPFAALYPRSQQRIPGQGSDREDALRVELHAVTHHQYPYDARTYLGHRPTPLPGAMWLAAPFYFLRHTSFQNVVWLAAFAFFLTRFFRSKITSAVFLLIFLVAALENLDEFVLGGDYVTNIFYVSVALYLVSLASSRERPGWKDFASAAFLGIAISSRVIYVMVLPPVFAFLWQRIGKARAIGMMTTSLVSAALATLPVFWPHPVTLLGEQLRQNGDKLVYMPAIFQWPFLVILALAISCSGFFLRKPMDLPKVFCLAGLSIALLIGLPMAFIAKGWLPGPLPTDLEYFAAPSLLLCLWAFARAEHVSCQPAIQAS